MQPVYSTRLGSTGIHTSIMSWTPNQRLQLAGASYKEDIHLFGGGGVARS